MIKVQNNIPTREPLPSFLLGLAPESLADLSWTDASLGVQDCAWWPEDSVFPTLGADEKFGTEILTLDTERRVVLVSYEVVPMTAEEIAARDAKILEEKQRQKAELEASISALQQRLATLSGW